jgi:hypothetical protein
MTNMISAGTFDGPLAKLERAKHHLSEARTAEQRFFENCAAKIRVDRDPNTGAGVARIMSCSPSPVEMPILVSEIIHHIRSALDNSLTTVLVKSGWQETTSNDQGRAKKDRRYFPSGEDEKKFKNSCKTNLKGLCKNVAEVIKASNNFSGGSGDLHAVFTASNRDKHWELTPMSALVTPNGLCGYTLKNVNITIGQGGNLHKGIVIGCLSSSGSITPNNPDAHVPVSGSFTIIGLGDYDGKEITPMLEAAISSAESVISSLVSLTQSISGAQLESFLGSGRWQP